MPIDSQFEFHSALHYSSMQLAQILSHCFENYIVPFVIDGETFSSRFAAEDLSLNHSIVVTHQQHPVALALIARRGQHSRVAALSIHPEMRGRGLGRTLMQRIIADARTRGDRRLSLEVIAGNQAALALYQQVGLAITRTLWGFHAPLATPEPSATLQPIDPLALAQQMTADGQHGLPWLIAPESLYKLPGSPRAFTLEKQAFALVIPGAQQCHLRMIYVPPALRGQGQARLLLQALQAQFAPLALSANVFVPDDIAPFFQHLGWREDPLRQFEMTMAI
ncbi:GNAT family N-acetyltransferase [Serratia fonticola]|uniref:GNAT family N-acetyltransferase n=1 Tax=Serratia fonticola TaxID=47917 RepID=UPI002177AD1C|nr:GNAT family N-acetyltransferase [Serratia fonticola]CAI0810981.1 N-acyltransferase YncA [Serratia fonticola]